MAQALHTGHNMEGYHIPTCSWRFQRRLCTLRTVLSSVQLAAHVTCCPLRSRNTPAPDTSCGRETLPPRNTTTQ